MTTLVDRLRQARSLPFREKHCGLYTQAANEIERLQRIIDSRPAINAALPESYIEWSQNIYLADYAQASGRQS